MENIYNERLKNIMQKYDMICNSIVDSTYIHGLIIKMFQEHCTNKRIALWGAGRNNSITSHASVILGKYSSQLQGMVCLIDSDKNMQGGEMLGFSIISPEEAVEKQLDLIIVASRASAESIKKSITAVLPGCEVLDIYQELKNQGVELFYNFYEEKSQYVRLYELRKEYEGALQENEKKAKLKELISTYLAIRDFVYTFRYAQCYCNAGYDQDGKMRAMMQEIQQLINEVRNKNRNRENDITIYFIDSVRAMDVMDNFSGDVNFRFIEPYLKQSLVFTNAYSTGPTTYESLIGILTKQYSYTKDVYADNFMFDIEEVPFLQKACEKNMAIHFYVSEEYKIIKPDNRIEFHNHVHMTEKLWNLACDKAVSGKPVLSLAYIAWELHFPLLCGYSRNRPEIHNFSDVGMKDMSGYIESQFEDCFAYVNKEFLYYEDILHDNGYSVLFSDHSQVVYDRQHYWPFYKYYNDPEKQTHCMFTLRGPSVPIGIYDKYISMIHFNDILCKYLFHENIHIEEDDIVRYQYYNIHNWELRKLAVEKGYVDYIDGMNCYISKEYVYMVNIYGRQEVYRRGDIEENIADTKEGKQFISDVKAKFETSFPDFLLERINN